MSLVYFDPKSYQNACLYKTALSPRLLRFQTSKAMWHLQRWGMESFFMKVLHWIWRLLHGTTVSWNKLFQLIMWSLMHFNSIKAQLEILNFDQWLWYMCRWHARQNEGVTGTLEDHDLQTSTGESYICNQAQHKKVLFSGLKFINVAPLNNDSRKVQWSDSYKQPQNEKRQIWSSPHPPHQRRWTPVPTL